MDEQGNMTLYTSADLTNCPLVIQDSCVVGDITLSGRTASSETVKLGQARQPALGFLQTQ